MGCHNRLYQLIIRRVREGQTVLKRSNTRRHTDNQPGRNDYDRIARGRDYFGDFDPFGDFDLLFGAAKQNLRIVEVPVRYRPRTYGTTNTSGFTHGWLLVQMCVYAARKLLFIA